MWASVSGMRTMKGEINYFGPNNIDVSSCADILPMKVGL